MYSTASRVVVSKGQGGKCCGMGWGGAEGAAPSSSWATDTGVACKTAAVDQQNLNLSTDKPYGKAENGSAM